LPYTHTSAGVLDGILAEPAATNLCTTNTEANSYFNKTRCTVSSNVTTAPDGLTTADKVVLDATAAATHSVLGNVAINFTSGTIYQFSVYAKAAELSWIYLRANTGAFPGGSYAYFDVGTGAVGTVGADVNSAAIEDVGNGWYRCSISITANATTTDSLKIHMAEADNDLVIDGDSASGFYIWGWQVETNVLTSPILTYGATATRARDLLSLAGANFPISASDEHTLYQQGSYSGPRGATVKSLVILTIDGLEASDQIGASIYDDNLQDYVYLSSVLQSNSGDGTYFSSFPKTFQIASSFETNNVLTAIDGSAFAADTTVTLPAVDEIMFGYNANDKFIIKKVLYLPTPSTEADLEAMSA
ncbi:MAG: hypothetical protein OEL78_01625, partial [Hyphomicrobiales bacterium]|nr:hypothetical protein [Hyphomicrobiales bacterium]